MSTPTRTHALSRANMLKSNQIIQSAARKSDERNHTHTFIAKIYGNRNCSPALRQMERTSISNRIATFNWHDCSGITETQWAIIMYSFRCVNWKRLRCFATLGVRLKYFDIMKSWSGKREPHRIWRIWMLNKHTYGMYVFEIACELNSPSHWYATMKVRTHACRQEWMKGKRPPVNSLNIIVEWQR